MDPENGVYSSPNGCYISFCSEIQLSFSLYGHYSDFQLKKLFPAAILYFQLVRKLQILHHSVAHLYRFKVTKGLPLVPHGYFLAFKKLVVG
jgi:hypothetical protein